MHLERTRSAQSPGTTTGRPTSRNVRAGQASARESAAAAANHAWGLQTAAGATACVERETTTGRVMGRCALLGSSTTMSAGQPPARHMRHALVVCRCGAVAGVMTAASQVATRALAPAPAVRGSTSPTNAQGRAPRSVAPARCAAEATPARATASGLLAASGLVMWSPHPERALRPSPRQGTCPEGRELQHTDLRLAGGGGRGRITAMERTDLQDAARALGVTMEKMARSGVFPAPVGPCDSQELFSFAQALGVPAGDGSHLARVVRGLSSALAAALGRRASGS
jgi:hypothetical protein